ncbi:MAG TPA: hypothetical protein VMG81_03655 [Thermoplasmata archaeon]|nr:hypothetical protein [Thermoplasmata archaeon]
MNEVPLSELDRLARAFAGDRHDEYSQRALARAYEEFAARRRSPLAPFVLTAEGKDYPTLFALLGDPAARFATGELRLDPAPPPGPAWEFLLPFERIDFHDDGSADVHPIALGPPTRAIARLVLREHYLTRTRVEEHRAAAGGGRVQVAGFTGTVQAGIALARQQGLLPFSVALMLYLPEERFRYELDLLRSTLLPDPRAGRLALPRRVRRTSRLSWGVDRAVARGDISLLAGRCLEVLVESSGLTSVELAHVFGGVRELVDSALQSLVDRRLVVLDRRTGIYRARLDQFLPATGAASPEAESLAPADPALRTSVQELIAAADARATCPLCGAPLPPGGPTSILCADCTAKVGAN